MNPTIDDKYKDAIRSLLESNIVFNKTVLVTKEGNIVKGFWFYCQPLLKDKKLLAARKALGNTWKCYYLPNLQEIHIELL